GPPPPPGPPHRLRTDTGDRRLAVRCSTAIPNIHADRLLHGVIAAGRYRVVRTLELLGHPTRARDWRAHGRRGGTARRAAPDRSRGDAARVCTRRSRDSHTRG